MDAVSGVSRPSDPYRSGVGLWEKPRRAYCILLPIVLMLLSSPVLIPQEGQLERALSLIKAQRPAEAEQVLANIPAADPDYCTAQTLLGYLFLQRSALPDAEKAFRIVLATRSSDAQARLGLGATLLKEGSVDKANAELEKILEDPEVGFGARIQWIYGLLYAGRADEAFQQAQSLAEEYDASAAVHHLLGYLHQIRSERGAALREYLRVVQLEPDSVPAYMDLISAYQDQGDWDDALSYAKQALQLDGNNPLLYQMLASIYQKLGAAEQAGAARSQAERAFEAEVLYAKAAKSRAAGRIREAEAYLRESTRKNQHLSKAWCDLGELSLEDGRLEDARTDFLHALDTSPGDARAVAGLAATLHAQGKDLEALRYCQEAVAKGSASPDVLTAMANIYMAQDRAQAAAEVMTRAVQQLPGNPDLLSYLGYLQQSMGSAQEARETFAAALRLNPQQVDALIGQAYAMLARGQTRDALASLNLARSVDSRNAEVWKGLIEAYAKSGDRKSAEESCRQCLAVNARDLDCREQLAAFRVADGDYREAASQYQTVLHSGKSSRSVLDGLAYSFMMAGDFDRAIQYSERSIQQFGPDARVYAVLGYLYRSRGDVKRAAAAYRRARDAEPKDPQRNFDLGLSLYLARDYPGAAGSLRSAISLKPDYGQAHYYLALVYWNLRQYDLAILHAHRAQDLNIQAAKVIIQTLTSNLSLAASKKLP